jgi:trk system potassium uptake protein TrkH
MRELRQLIHPRGSFVVNLGGRAVPERLMASIFGFLALYAISFLVLFVLLAQTGLDAITAFSAAVATITNLGPGLGSVASNFAGMSDIGVWLCTFAMILGRLEVMAVLVIFTPAFWAE